ncbi:prepilin peptidase [Candidatus Saccharibacteria bacterium]|nr:prepilin peptidase [Candidatus Saccharibacteria bacterium]
MLIVSVILGLCAGSFALAFTMRLFDGRDWVKGRSECENCHHELQWQDLIPLFSWLSTGGKCRYCNKSIGLTYPLVELGAGVLFGVSYAFWPYGFSKIGVLIFSLWLVILTLMISLIIFDLKWQILPDKVVYTLIGLALASKITQVFYFQDFSRVFGLLLGVTVGSGIFALLYFLSKGKYIGGGDVKYGIFFGVLLASGFKSLLVISIGSLLGTLVVLPSLLSKKSKLNAQIPFGPYLIIATIIVYLFGDKLVDLLTTFYLFP